MPGKVIGVVLGKLLDYLLTRTGVGHDPDIQFIDPQGDKDIINIPVFNQRREDWRNIMRSPRTAEHCNVYLRIENESGTVTEDRGVWGSMPKPLQEVDLRPGYPAVPVSVLIMTPSEAYTVDKMVVFELEEPLADRAPVSYLM